MIAPKGPPNAKPIAAPLTPPIKPPTAPPTAVEAIRRYCQFFMYAGFAAFFKIWGNHALKFSAAFNGVTILNTAIFDIRGN
jgi:hypothetical protein